MTNMNTRANCSSIENKHPLMWRTNNNYVKVASSYVNTSRNYSDAPPLTYTSVPQVFERIKAIASADMVKKVNACYVFVLKVTKVNTISTSKKVTARLGREMFRTNQMVLGLM